MGYVIYVSEQIVCGTGYGNGLGTAKIGAPLHYLHSTGFGQYWPKQTAVGQRFQNPLRGGDGYGNPLARDVYSGDGSGGGSFIYWEESKQKSRYKKAGR